MHILFFGDFGFTGVHKGLANFSGFCINQDKDFPWICHVFDDFGLKDSRPGGILQFLILEKETHDFSWSLDSCWRFLGSRKHGFIGSFACFGDFGQWKNMDSDFSSGETCFIKDFLMV